jgi:(R,R)-butanediol dehydrogenase/meso-butanediol dehydrogenase/diacetyl reductase
MRAAVYRGSGDIRVETVPDPGEPGPGEVVVEVARAAICGTDASEWAHGPILCRPPVVLGHEFTGRVVAAGADVALPMGARVVSGAGISCGGCEWCQAGRTNLCASYRTLGLQVDGGLAELVMSPASICRVVPDAVSDDAASMAQPFAVALHAVRRSRLAAGETCVVIGAGGIGAFIVAGAAARKPGKLIAVDIDPDRLATARGLGAGEALDARNGAAGNAPAGTARDAAAHLAGLILAATDGEGAHVVIEASGAPHAPAAALTAARRGGRVLLVGLQSAPRELDLVAATVREVELITTVAHVCSVDLPEAVDLLALGSVADAVLDRVIPLGELVDEGIRPLAERRARGKIVVRPD